MRSITTDSTFQLRWFGNGIGAPCVSTGGSGSDGWANSAGLVSNGSALVRESTPGTYTFTLTCTGGGQVASSSQTVVVTSATPAVSLIAAAPQQQVNAGPQPDLFWTTNAGGNCSISYNTNSGLSVAGPLLGEPSSGTISDAESATGLVTYTLQCGAASATTTIDWITAAVPNALSTTDTSWAANLAYPISWSSSVAPCTASGGGPADGWAGPKSQAGTQLVSESQPGGYLFTLVCGSGATATTSRLLAGVALPSIQIYSTAQISPGTSLPTPAITWLSTVGPCTYLDGSAPGSVGVPVAPSGSAVPAPAAAGTYLFSLTCGKGASALYAATLAHIPVSTPTTLVANPATAEVDAPVTLTWNSGGGPCYAFGGDGTAPWSGPLPGTGSGSLIVTSRYAATISYTVSCSTDAHTVVNYVAVPATSANGVSPAVTLSASASTQTANESITLTWNSMFSFRR